MKIEICRRALLPLFAAILAGGAAFGRLDDTALAATPEGGQFIMMVFNNAVDGKEAEYNEWYNKIHAQEVVTQTGFDFAQRFGRAPVAMGKDAPRDYVIIYSGDSKDLAASYAQYFVEAAKAPRGPQMIKPGTNYNDSLAQVGSEIKGAGAAGGGAAQNYLWFVYGKGSAGKEAAFKTWFDGDFAKGMAKVPGVVSAQPYMRSEAQLGTSHGEVVPPPHLILFRIRTNDLAATMNAAKQAQSALKSEAADPASWLSFGFRELGPPIRP